MAGLMDYDAEENLEKELPKNPLSDETLEMLLFAKCNSDKLLSIKH